MATISDLAKFARAAYGNAPIPSGSWVALDPVGPNNDDYYGQAYVNVVTKEIVITHRGTSPTRTGDLKSDFLLALSYSTDAQQDAAAYVLSVLRPYKGQGYKIINTGHSLGGNDAQAAIVALVDAGYENVSGVVFNSPGIGGFTHNLPAANYNVLTISAQGDLIHYAGGDHLGQMVTVDAGPTLESETLGNMSLGLAGPLGVLVGAALATKDILVNAHGIDTIISYLGKDIAFGGAQWTSNTQTPHNPSGTPIQASASDGNFEINFKGVNVKSVASANSWVTQSQYSLEGNDANGSHVKIQSDAQLTLSYSENDSAGHLVTDWVARHDGTGKLTNATNQSFSSLERNSDSVTHISYSFTDGSSQSNRIESKISLGGYGSHETIYDAAGALVSEIVLNKDGSGQRVIYRSGQVFSKEVFTPQGAISGFSDFGQVTFSYDENSVGVKVWSDGQKVIAQADHQLIYARPDANGGDILTQYGWWTADNAPNGSTIHGADKSILGMVDINIWTGNLDALRFTAGSWHAPVDHGYYGVYGTVDWTDGAKVQYYADSTTLQANNQTLSIYQQGVVGFSWYDDSSGYSVRDQTKLAVTFREGYPTMITNMPTTEGNADVRFGAHGDIASITPHGSGYGTYYLSDGRTEVAGQVNDSTDYYKIFAASGEVEEYQEYNLNSPWSSTTWRYRDSVPYAKFTDDGNGSLVANSFNEDGTIASSAHIVVGTDGDDMIVEFDNTSFVAGAGGDDHLEIHSAHSVIGFNRGDGSDTLVTTPSSSSVLSIAKISLNEIYLQRESDDLVVDFGSGDEVRLVNWYAVSPARGVANLQVFVTADDQGDSTLSEFALHKIDVFDFATLVRAFDTARSSDPTLSQWHIVGALAGALTQASDKTALGGAVAQNYAVFGQMWDNVPDLLTVVVTPWFGSTMQPTSLY